MSGVTGLVSGGVVVNAKKRSISWKPGHQASKVLDRKKRAIRRYHEDEEFRKRAQKRAAGDSVPGRANVAEVRELAKGDA